MSGERVGKVLERVAREQAGAAAKCNNPVHFTAALREVLEERLGPLLRAGQGMRDCIGPWDLRYEPLGVKGRWWDVALAALEREPK